MKRFYKEVTVAEVDGGFGIKLDERTLRTPAKRPLILPTGLLAEALAEEWAAQQGEIRPDTMPTMNAAMKAPTGSSMSCWRLRLFAIAPRGSMATAIQPSARMAA